SGQRYLFPKNRVSIRQRYPYVEVWPANGVSKAPVFSGQADDLSVNTEVYSFQVNAHDFIQTNIDIEGNDIDITVAAGDSLGSGGSVIIGGNMLAGTITIASGTGSKSTGPLAVITLPRAFPNGFYLFLQPRNNHAAT